VVGRSRTEWSDIVLMTNDNDIWKQIRAAMDSLDRPTQEGVQSISSLETALADVIGLARSISVTAEEMLRAVAEGAAVAPAEYGDVFIGAPSVLDAARETLTALLLRMQAS
jgi:hypothetical protein